MLSVTRYPPEFVAACWQRVARQLASYDALKESAVAGGGGSAVAAFEADFFSNLILALDNSFCHRARGVEGKDGNPLNEVRLLSAAILDNDGVLRADKTIRYDPARAVLGLAVGNRIQLDGKSFAALSAAFLDEIARKYP